MRISVAILLAASLLPALAAESVAENAAGGGIWELRGTVASGAPLRPPAPAMSSAAGLVDFRDLDVETTGSIGGFELPSDERTGHRRTPAAMRRPQKLPGTNLPDFLDDMPLVTDLIAIQRKFNIKASRHHIESRVNVPVALADPKASRLFGRPWERAGETAREEAALTRPPLVLGD